MEINSAERIASRSSNLPESNARVPEILEYDPRHVILMATDEAYFKSKIPPQLLKFQNLPNVARNNQQLTWAVDLLKQFATNVIGEGQDRLLQGLYGDF